MLCNIKPVPFHESDKHIFAKIPGGGGGSGPPVPPSGSAHVDHSISIGTNGLATKRRISYIPGGFYQSIEPIFEKSWNNTISYSGKERFFPFFFFCYDLEALLDDRPNVMFQRPGIYETFVYCRRIPRQVSGKMVGKMK